MGITEYCFFQTGTTFISKHVSHNFYIPQTQYLKNVVRSIWQVNDVTSYQNEIIIPKGVVEIIFNLGECSAIESNIDNSPFQLTKCWISGFNTYPVQLQLPKQQFFFGVQFHPFAVRHFFGAPACEFANAAIDLTLIDASFKCLWHQLAEVKTFNERVHVIHAWLQNKVVEPCAQDLFLNAFLKNANKHTITIQALAQTVCYSPRHLSRKIYELTAMNTERLLLYKKFLHAADLIYHTDLALTNIAYHSGFADQSHFIRTFKMFANITPKQYKQTKSNVPGHIFHNVR